jgi:hypothetical protein
MPTLAAALRGLILFSTLLGVLFLFLAFGSIPAPVFDLIGVGWVFFVAASVMLFVRPRTAFAMAFVLAILALSVSLPEPAHYAFFTAGEFLQGTVFLLGSSAQALLIVLVPYYFYKHRGGD